MGNIKYGHTVTRLWCSGSYSFFLAILPNATNLNSEGIQVQLMACEIQTLTSNALSILPSQELGSLSLAECNNNGTLWRKWNDSGRQTETTDPIIASVGITIDHLDYPAETPLVVVLDPKAGLCLSP